MNALTVVTILTVLCFYTAVIIMIAAYMFRKSKDRLSGSLKKISIYLTFAGLGLFLVWGILRAISNSPHF